MANIFQLANIISDQRNTIDYMRQNGLLKNQLQCCGINTSKVMDVGTKDNEIFQWNQCKKCFSICTNSYYFNSNLPLTVHITILYIFANGSKVNECLRFLDGKCSKKNSNPMVLLLQGCYD